MANVPFPIPLPADGSFDPSWLIEAIRKHDPEDTALHAAAQRCTSYLGGSDLFVYFVSLENANVPGAEWQIERQKVIQDSRYGEIVIDILEDGRIGGVEFLANVFSADIEELDP